MVLRETDEQSHIAVEGDVPAHRAQVGGEVNFYRSHCLGVGGVAVAIADDDGAARTQRSGREPTRIQVAFRHRRQTLIHCNRLPRARIQSNPGSCGSVHAVRSQRSIDSHALRTVQGDVGHTVTASFLCRLESADSGSRDRAPCDRNSAGNGIVSNLETTERIDLILSPHPGAQADRSGRGQDVRILQAGRLRAHGAEFDLAYGLSRADLDGLACADSVRDGNVAGPLDVDRAGGGSQVERITLRQVESEVARSERDIDVAAGRPRTASVLCGDIASGCDVSTMDRCGRRVSRYRDVAVSLYAGDRDRPTRIARQRADTQLGAAAAEAVQSPIKRYRPARRTAGIRGVDRNRSLRAYEHGPELNRAVGVDAERGGRVVDRVASLNRPRGASELPDTML